MYPFAQHPAQAHIQAQAHAHHAAGGAASTLPPDMDEGGMPADRGARLAARRAFVSLKLSFLYVVEGLDDHPDLKREVRNAEAPEELWRLRAPVFAALEGHDAVQRGQRQLLNRSLDSMFSTLQAEPA